ALSAAARDERLSVQVYGYAMKEGNVLDTLALDTTLDLSKHGASLRSEGLRLLTAFAVSPGAVELRFFARAAPSGETGSIRQQVEMPAPGEGQLLLSAPLLTLPPTGRIAVPMDSRNGAQLEIPFRLGSERFIPDSSSALQPGGGRDLCVFVWRARPGSTDPLAVTGELAQPGQDPLPLSVKSVRVVPDADGYDRYVVTIVPPPAPPGSYTLRLTLQDAGTGLAARTEAEIVLTN
ncbi:MAG TPA: hypothetical protein VI589_01010, partial [Vicinamibacteria bacterium]